MNLTTPLYFFLFKINKYPRSSKIRGHIFTQRLGSLFCHFNFNGLFLSIEKKLIDHAQPQKEENHKRQWFQ